jgi:hypothetical protein
MLWLLDDIFIGDVITLAITNQGIPELVTVDVSVASSRWHFQFQERVVTDPHGSN